MLYHHNFRVRKAEPGEPGGKTPGWFFLLIIGVYVVASPAILLPQVWQYLDAYLSEHLLTHSGYLFADQLYKNNMSSSPFWGTPLYFYLLFLAIKVPLVTGAAFHPGSHRRSTATKGTWLRVSVVHVSVLDRSVFVDWR